MGFTKHSGRQQIVHFDLFSLNQESLPLNENKPIDVESYRSNYSVIDYRSGQLTLESTNVVVTEKIGSDSKGNKGFPIAIKKLTLQLEVDPKLKSVILKKISTKVQLTDKVLTSTESSF